MKIITTILLTLLSFGYWSQFGDCGNLTNACTNPSFSITPSSFGNIEEFTTSSTVSNPQSNPNAAPGNDGCLQSGELNSTWMLISVGSAGTLEFSMGDPTAGSANCYDWIMWEYDANTCSAIASNSLPPVACNWNGNCNDFSGMANPGNLPTGGDWSNFEYGLNVNAGDQFILCFSNYSSANTNVPLNFFGTSNVSCGNVNSPSICEGETATLVATNGLSYSWDTSIPGFINTNAAGNIAYVNPTVTTNYTVNITSGTGTAPEIATVTVFPQITITTTPTLETCLGDGDGQLTFTLTNGASPFTYDLSGTATATNNTGTFTNLASGNYTIDITDANGCTAQATTTLNPGAPCCAVTVSSVETNNNCFGECIGTSAVTPAGTTGAISYQWFDNTNAPIAGATAANITTLCAGNYKVEVTDAICTISHNITITEPTALDFTFTKIDLLCNNDNSGSVSITANGGTPAYSYSSDNGATFQASSNLDNLSAGTYDLVVKDFNNCTKTYQTTLVEPQLLSATSSVNNLTCNENNGACDGGISVVPTGGTLPFTYVWNNSLPNQPVQNSLCASSYELEITDANGCVFNLPTMLITEPNELIIDSVHKQAPLCQGECNGWLEIFSTVGTSYSIDNGVNFNNTNLFNNLCLGTYDIQIKDANGCKTNSTETLSSPSAVVADFTFGPQPTTIVNSTIAFTNSSSNYTSASWFTVVDADTIRFFDDNPTYEFPNDLPDTYNFCLVVDNAGNCLDTLCKEVIISDDFFLYIPTAFSPNGDGFNDVFNPVISNYKEGSFRMIIFNRWGEKEFETTDPTKPWTGEFNASNTNMNVYLWKIWVKKKDSVLEQEYTGTISIIP